uniref:Uncharacterized protein n=1 Tax=Anguilla anguilla TaxID=7936 RepID=A0A0E9VMU4_ANGAN
MDLIMTEPSPGSKHRH